MNNFKQLPLRIGVGILLLNSENKVFVGKRIDNPQSFWQMPQGGVDKNEEINIKTKNPEFLDWQWINSSELPNISVNFKTNIYKRLEEELKILNLN